MEDPPLANDTLVSAILSARYDPGSTMPPLSACLVPSADPVLTTMPVKSMAEVPEL